MSSLRQTFAGMASAFVQGLLDAIQNVSIEELVSEASARPAQSISTKVPVKFTSENKKPGRKGRLPRRNDEDIVKVVDRIVVLLVKKPKGLRAEQIREELGLEAKELPRPLAEALKRRVITKTGEKRATTYTVGGGKKATKKAAPKKSKATKKAAPKKSKATNKAVPKKAAPKAKSNSSAPVNNGLSYAGDAAGDE